MQKFVGNQYQFQKKWVLSTVCFEGISSTNCGAYIMQTNVEEHHIHYGKKLYVIKFTLFFFFLLKN